MTDTRGSRGTVKLRDIAKIIRSKNAKPFRLTLDVIFEDRETFEYVRDREALTRDVVARAYRLAPEAVSSSYVFESGLAFKFTLRRPRAQGSPGESDMYGAQQHAPLLDVEISYDESAPPAITAVSQR